MNLAWLAGSSHQDFSYFCSRHMTLTSGEIPQDLILNDHQERLTAYAETSGKTAIVTSRRSGTTTWACAYAVHQALFGECDVHYVTRSESSDAFDMALGMCQRLPWWLRVGMDHSRTSIYFPNGNEVQFRTMLPSASSFLIVDDAAYCDFADYQIRQLLQATWSRCILMSCGRVLSSGETNWFRELLVDCDLRGKLLDSVVYSCTGLPVELHAGPPLVADANTLRAEYLGVFPVMDGGA